MTKGRAWAVGGRCFLLTHQYGVQGGTVEDLRSRGDVMVRLNDGLPYWTQVTKLDRSRSRLYVTWLRQELAHATHAVRVASKEESAASKRKQRAISKVAALSRKLDAARAKEAKL